MAEEIQNREEVDRSPFHGLWTLSNRELKKWYNCLLYTSDAADE